jgi:hypothetical protein
MKTKNASRHTPGPWIAGESLVFVGPRAICQMECDGLPFKDNARLIARAPSMLSVMRSVVEMIRSSNEFKSAPGGILSQAVDGMEWEISKAEGR